MKLRSQNEEYSHNLDVLTFHGECVMIGWKSCSIVGKLWCLSGFLKSIASQWQLNLLGHESCR